jgi:gas vesicle protein
MSAGKFFSVLVGAAAGAAAAWWLHSEKGQETVADIKEKAAAGFDQLGNAVEDLKVKAKASAKAAVETLEEAVEKKQ